MAEGLIEIMFDDKGTWDTNLSKSEDHAEWAIKAVKKFQEERIAAKVRTTIQTRGWVREDLPSFRRRPATRPRRSPPSAFPPRQAFFPRLGQGGRDCNMFATGVDFLDVALKGGHAPGEVYGVLGPFASCKTTLAVMLCVEGCRQAAAVLKETGEHQYVFLASYEAGLPELRIRTLSYAAKIKRSSLEHMGQQGLAVLSTAKHLLPYEGIMFAAALDAGQKVLGERGRAKLAMKLLEKHLIILDMTGGDEQHRGAGSGYVAEITSRIKAELRGRGPDASCRLTIIDYVGAMAKRHLTVANKAVDELRHWVANAPLEAKNQIAAKYACPVWLMHQISGAANTKAPGAQYHHTDAAESKSFAENLDFSFSVGTPNAMGLCQLIATKHRRTGHQAAQIVQIQGDMSTVVDAGHLYMLDPFTHHFVATDGVHPASSESMHVAHALTSGNGQADDDDLGLDD